MADPKNYFWTDFQQAFERLNHSVVLYEGEPVYVNALTEGREYDEHRDIPRAHIMVLSDRSAQAQRKLLNSPHFNRFRVPVELGWINTTGNSVGAIFAQRRVATTRLHGLTSGNTSFYRFTANPDGSYRVQLGDINFTDVIFSQSFIDMHKGNYPSLGGILQNIRPGTAIAYSRLYCVLRDQTGIRWLYRGIERVGIFTGADTLNLLTKYSYLREEIMADKAFTLNTIREF